METSTKKPPTSSRKSSSKRPPVKKDEATVPEEEDDIDKLLGITTDSKSSISTASETPEETVSSTKTQQRSTDKKDEPMCIFFSRVHPWSTPFKPLTLVVARNKDEATALLTQTLMEKFPSFPESLFENISVSPSSDLIAPGVSIMNLGGIIDEEIKDEELRKRARKKPIQFQYKSKFEPSDWKVFYCNNHYSANRVPPASLVVAGDFEEAGEFMKQSFEQLSLKFDVIASPVFPVVTEKNCVVFLTEKQ